MLLAIISYLLIVQGSGQSNSTPTQLGQPYKTEVACKADGEKLSRIFWMRYICLEVNSDH